MMSAGGGCRRRLTELYAVLIGANLAAWGWAFAAFGGNAVLLGTALLAYGFGLRHAVDADHIAAIDNVTRKLMQEGKRPIAVGFFFALGHSTVVVIAATAIAVAAGTLSSRFPGLIETGEAIGTAVSALFLLAIGAVNAAVLIAVHRRFRRAKAGECDSQPDTVLTGTGMLSWSCRRLFRLMSQSWHMYPLGVLFGLGFDTASEIGLLGIAASEAAHGLPIWSILVFPALFTAGMSLIDATNGVVMLGAYGWAFVDPVRKLRYNLTITGLSVVVALLVGGVEATGIVSEKLGVVDGPWNAIGAAAADVSSFGYVIIAVLVASWLVSLLGFRLTRYGKLGA